MNKKNLQNLIDSNKKFSIVNFFNIPDEIKDKFSQDCICKNKYSVIVISFLIFLAEIFSVIRALFFFKSRLHILNDQIYFTMHCLLIIAAVMTLIIQKIKENDAKYLEKIYFCFSFFLMVWHAVFNAYDLSKGSTGGATIILTIFFGISVFIQLKPIYMCINFSVAYALFLGLAAPLINNGIIINFTISTIISCFIFITRYKYIIIELVQQNQISKINQQLKDEQDKLRLSLEKHEIIMKQSNDIMFEWEIDKDQVIFSQNWEDRFEYPTVVPNISQWISKNTIIREQDRQSINNLMCKIRDGSAYEELEVEVTESNCQIRWYNIRVSMQYDKDGKPSKGIGILMDIDKQKKQLIQLKSLLQIDPLTGIMNKIAIQNYAHEYLLNICSGEMLIMFMLDLDGFKKINDTYGHPCGDYILTETAKILQTVFNEKDVLGRVGGDEFSVIMTNVKDKIAIKNKSVKLLKKISEIKWMNQYIGVSCSIGIAIAHNSKMSYEQLYKNADAALYKAKQLGKATYSVFETKGTEQNVTQLV